MAKIAIATTDGTSIDIHFGQARSFRIYEVEEGGHHRFVEERQVAGDEASPADHSAAARILSDVEAVLVSRIGPGATAALKAAGVKAFAVKGSVNRALEGYAKRGKLLKEAVPGSLEPCSSAPEKSPCGCGCNGARS